MKSKIAVSLISLGGVISSNAQTFILNPENGHYYAAVLSVGISWQDANAHANSLTLNGANGYLATVGSESENIFLSNTFFNVFRDSSSMYAAQALIGGFQSPSNETNPQTGWSWVNGEGTFPGVNGDTSLANFFSNWASASDAIGDPFYSPTYPGEPNDANGPANEQYLALFRFSNAIGKWNDVSGSSGDSSIAGYIVEVSPVPEPSIFAGIAGLSLVVFSLYRRIGK